MNPLIHHEHSKPIHEKRIVTFKCSSSMLCLFWLFFIFSSSSLECSLCARSICDFKLLMSSYIFFNSECVSNILCFSVLCCARLSPRFCSCVFKCSGRFGSRACGVFTFNSKTFQHKCIYEYGN